MSELLDNLETLHQIVSDIRAELAAERERNKDFCMDYRIKCDEETKAALVEVSKLREVLVGVRQAIMWGKDALPIIDSVLSETKESGDE